MKKYLAILMLPFFISCSSEQKPELVIPVGHLGNIKSVCFSSDSKYALTSSTDMTAKLWDVRRGRLMHNFEGHTDELFTAAFSSDEKSVVTISRDKTVRRWDINTGKEIMRSLTDLTINGQTPVSKNAEIIITNSGFMGDEEHDMDVRLWNTQGPKWKQIARIPGTNLDNRISQSFSPTGNTIALISNDGFLCLADYKSGKILHKLEKLTDMPVYSGFSPDSKYFLSSSEDSIRIWNASSGQLNTIIKDGTFTAFTVSSSSRLLAVPSVDGNVKIYDLNGGSLVQIIGKENLSSQAGNLIFSSDDKNLLIDMNNGSLIMWEIEGKRKLFTVEGGNPAAFSKDGNYLITSANALLGMWAESLDQVPKIWDARTGRLLSRLEGHAKYVSSTQFSPDGGKIITGSYDRSAKLWDIKNAKLLNRLRGDQLVFNTVQFSRDGKYILTSAENQAIKVWNVDNGKLMFFAKGDTSLANPSLGATFMAKFSPDSKLIVTSWSTDESVKIFDIESGSLKHEFICPTPVTLTAFSSNSGELAIASGDRCARIWDLQSGRLKYLISDDNESQLNSYDSIFSDTFASSTSQPARFSPDGNTVFTSPASGITEAWDVTTGKLLYTLKNITLLENPFSPDSRYFITVSGGDSLSQVIKSFNVSTVREIKTGRPVHSFKGNANVLKPFSPDKSKIITTSSRGDIFVWNLLTGAMLSTLPAENPNTVLAGVSRVWFSADGSRVISRISNGNVNVWDPNTGKIIKTIEMDPGSEFSETFSPNGLFLVQGPPTLRDTSASHFTYLWDLQTLKQIQKFSWDAGLMDPASVNSHTFSPDGLTILTVSGDETTRLWDTRTGEILTTFKQEKGAGFEATGTKLTGPFSPDSKLVLGTSEGKTRIFDIQKKVWLPAPEKSDEYAITYRFTPDSKMLISYSDNAIRLWNANTGKQIRSLEGSEGVQFTPVLSNGADKALVTLNDGNTWVWNLTSGKIIQRLDTVPVEPTGYSITSAGPYSLMNRDNQPGFKNIAFSPDGNSIVTSSESSLKIWNQKNGRLVYKSKPEEFVYGITSAPFSKDGKRVAADFFVAENSDQDRGIETHIIDLETGETKLTLKGQTVFLNGQQESSYSPDGEAILTQVGSEGFRLYNALNGELKHEFKWKDKDRIPGSAFISPDGRFIITSSMKANEQGYIIKYEPLDIWDAVSGKKLRVMDAGSSKTMDINWESGKVMNVINSMVTLFDIATGEKQVSFVAVNDEDYVFILPSGEYMGTTGGVKYLSWRLNNKLYDFDQWDLQYNRPDKVLEQLDKKDTSLIGMYHKAYLKRLKRSGFKEEMLSAEWHAPEIKILNQEDFSVPVSKPERELKISSSDTRYLLDRINVWINDVPVYGRNGLSLKKEKTSSIEKSIPVSLSAGLNKIQVSCINEKGVESLKEAVEIIYNPSVESKPDLYILAMSVSEYKDSRYNLEYAVKDGKDIATMFGMENPGRASYGHIYTDTIFNRSATRENFSGFREKLLKTGINDQVVLFVSGHGLLDKNMDFYFATYDIDFSRPEARGISFNDLEDLLDSIPARKKILMMDACHSGEVDKEEGHDLIAAIGAGSENITFRGAVKEYNFKGVNSTESQSGANLATSFDLMQELFTGLDKGTGTVVISAAAGKGYAMESKQWNNGVFTYTILNGLKNKAADKNNDKKVSISELKDYSIREVEELTNGKQKPTSRREAIASDWTIW
jgi:WD40 repeat protein